MARMLLVPHPKKAFEQRNSSNKRLGQGLGKWWEKEVRGPSHISKTSMMNVWKKSTVENQYLHTESAFGCLPYRENQ